MSRIEIDLWIRIRICEILNYTLIRDSNANRKFVLSSFFQKNKGKAKKLWSKIKSKYVEINMIINYNL